jgi:hypothetical protein
MFVQYHYVGMLMVLTSYNMVFFVNFFFLVYILHAQLSDVATGSCRRGITKRQYEKSSQAPVDSYTINCCNKSADDGGRSKQRRR